MSLLNILEEEEDRRRVFIIKNEPPVRDGNKRRFENEFGRHRRNPEHQKCHIRNEQQPKQIYKRQLNDSDDSDDGSVNN